MSQDNPLKQARELGQSLWLDFIQRSMLDGELQQLIDDGIMGLTSNPSIFEKAIAKTSEYDDTIRRVLQQEPDASAFEVFTRLAVEDIQGAADAFATTYRETDRTDGMVSLEVSPDLAHDTEGTIELALELNERVNRPNAMIKVPGTKAGVDAFEELTARGLNINVTLLFSVARYREIAQAYIRGLERRHADGGAIDGVRSVASFFVSRVDAAVDEQLDAIGSDEAKALRGKIAIANAKLAYGHFANLFGSEQFKKLEAHGAEPQRLLWASTSTKDPDYRDVLYMEELMGAQTVNTAPPDTLEAFRDHGVVEPRLTDGLSEARDQIDRLGPLGISLDDITEQLEKEGIDSFAEAFDRLLESLNSKRERLAS